jgi:CDP-diacylglycerol---glycerol-3-phosphate 3-phosphatidyltransferase
MDYKKIAASFESQKPNIFDRFFEKTIFRIVPYWVNPNHLTIFRYITIPFILILLFSKYYLAALVLFFFSIFSDALDGAMARTRNRITEWGELHDPISDKLLIGSVGFFLITEYIGLALMLVVVGIELIIICFAFYKKIRKEKIASALFPGKVKMVFQSAALVLLLIYSVFSFAAIVLIAEIFLYLAIIFALISLFVYQSI